jgi:tripartite-type tricarboxylate transporter receptor subunit TctC
MVLTRRFALGLMTGAILFATTASAQEFPARVVRMVVPYPAGGPTDAIARIVAEDMGKTLGQNVIVENVAGASGAVGTRQVAKADPDGYTIVFGNNQTHGNNMFLLTNPGYDAIKDFAPLAGVGAFEHLFVVPKDSPAKSISDLVEIAKRDPGRLNYGSTGVGSGSHLATELFMVRTGTKMTHVPFRGAAPLVQELMGGRIDVSNSTSPRCSARCRAATSGPSDSRARPAPPSCRTCPPCANRASPAPTRSPGPRSSLRRRRRSPVLDKLSGTIMASLNKPEIRDRIGKLGFSLNLRDPEAFRPYLAQEIQTWADIIRTAGLKPEAAN